MMFSKQFQLWTGVLLLLLVAGCSGEKRPNGFPKLYSLQITVLQEKQPVEGVSITLVSKDESVPWTVGGKTDSSGSADIMTHGKFKGAPSGTYSVVLEKSTTDNIEELMNGPDDTKPGRPSASSRKKKFKTYSEIDLKYTKAKTTPLELTIGEKGVQESFDVGPAVKTLISVSTPSSM